MANQNQAVILVKRPERDATPDCFEVQSQALQPLAAGEVRVAVEYVSVDAGARTMLMGEGFHRQVPLGGVVLAGAVGRIVESKAEGWAVGQAVRGHLGAQTIATSKPDLLEKVDGDVGPLSLHLGLLGGDRKGAYLTSQLGFDAVIDYKSQDVASELKRLAPAGVNVFFDNVGGAILDAVLDNLALRARVVICGAVSQYDNMGQVQGPSLYLRLAERQSVMEGFAYFHFPESIPDAKAAISQWIKEDSITLPEEILPGIESYPEALSFMFSGGNLGKLMVKI